MKTYLTEREGQIAFFDNFRIDYQHDEILIDNTDGVYKGCLFEFKLNINNLNAVLFQAIKYLSKMRVKGESVPGKILLVSLNNETCYVFKAEDYFTEIHEIYYGGASKNNADFIAQSEPEKIDYSNDTGAVKILDLFKTETYLKIDIDENCVVGWAVDFTIYRIFLLLRHIQRFYHCMYASLVFLKTITPSYGVLSY